MLVRSEWLRGIVRRLGKRCGGDPDRQDTRRGSGPVMCNSLVFKTDELHVNGPGLSALSWRLVSLPQGFDIGSKLSFQILLIGVSDSQKVPLVELLVPLVEL